jgi:hypothetical protein
MITFRVTTDIGDDHCVELTLPPEVPTGRVDLVVSVSPNASEPPARPTPLLAEETPLDTQARPIWEVFGEMLSDVPQEELERLPDDFSEQHDHYIYGLPKRSG